MKANDPLSILPPIADDEFKSVREGEMLRSTDDSCHVGGDIGHSVSNVFLKLTYTDKIKPGELKQEIISQHMSIVNEPTPTNSSRKMLINLQMDLKLHKIQFLQHQSNREDVIGQVHELGNNYKKKIETRFPNVMMQ